LISDSKVFTTLLAAALENALTGRADSAADGRNNALWQNAVGRGPASLMRARTAAIAPIWGIKNGENAAKLLEAALEKTHMSAHLTLLCL